MWTPGMTSPTGYSHRATAFSTLPGTDHYSACLILNAWELGPLGVGNASRWMNTRLTGLPSTSISG